jgi:hypothetical protein
MRFRLRMSDRLYGDYPQKSCAVRVSYYGLYGEPSSDIEEDAVAVRNLRALLIGKRSPKTFKDFSGEKIVAAGEKITGRHVRKLLDSWYWISFKGTVFEDKIRALKSAAGERGLQRDLESGEQQVTVFLNFVGSEVEDAEWIMSANVARWVGECLIEAADSALPIAGRRARVRGQRLSETKVR